MKIHEESLRRLEQTEAIGSGAELKAILERLPEPENESVVGFEFNWVPSIEELNQIAEGEWIPFLFIGLKRKESTSEES